MSHEEKDGIDRRGALECMIWAGTGVLWTMVAGVPRSSLLGISVANAQAAVRLRFRLELFFIIASHAAGFLEGNTGRAMLWGFPNG